MHPLLEIITADGEVVSLDDEDGRLSISYQAQDVGRQVTIPIDPLVLEMFAVAARNRPPRQTKVIPIRKFIPGNPASPRFA